MNMSSFVDEYEKIAASASQSKAPKTRIGRRPIRVSNLLKKADAKTEVVKKGLLPFLSKYRKPLGLLGLGAVGAKGLEEYVAEPLEYGYQVMRARGEI